MALATQCPYCHTAFRVANDQLKLHAGLVRCGACQQTFNGIEHLLSPGQATVALVAPPANSVSAAAATETAPADSRAVAETTTTVSSSDALAVSVSPQANTAHLASASALEFDMGEFELNEQAELAAELGADSETATTKPDADARPHPELALDAEVHDLELEIRSTLMNQEDADWSINTDPKSESEFVLASAAAITEQARNESALERKEPHFTSDESEQSEANESTSDELNPDSGNQNDSNDDDNQTHLEKPNFVVKAEKQKNRSRAIHYLMLFFSFLLLLSLLAQTTYSARDMIAAWFPQTKPTLQKLCVTLHCQIALPSQIDMITIESNELEALETGSKVFSLALQLQNKSSTLQNWPMLELILNDAKGKVLVQKAFPPSEYLSNKEDISKGFGAGSEQTVKLFFESTAGKASAYHVGVFYP